MWRENLPELLDALWYSRDTGRQGFWHNLVMNSSQKISSNLKYFIYNQIPINIMLCLRVLVLVNNYISMAGIAILPFLSSEMLEQKYFHSIIMVFVRNISYRNIFLFLILPSTIYKYDRKCYLHLRCSQIR